MTRAAAALALLAATSALAVAGTTSNFAQTQPNSATLTTQSSFAPSKLADPVISGTVLLTHTLSLAGGTRWGYVHPGGETLDTGGEQAITTIDQWQFCPTGLAASCATIPGAEGSTLSLTSSLLTSLGALSLIGAGFRVVETASNASASATPSTSNILVG